jgi:hypothetical protein
LRIFATLRSYSPKPIGSPCRAMVASRMMALSAAWRWISVSITSGASRVKAPSPLIGGSCPGSPSTRIGLPKLIRSRAISSPTMETSSSTMSFASAASLCGLSAKRGFFIWASAWRIALDARLGGGALEARQGADADLRLAHLLRCRLDLLLGRLEHAVDQAVDGARGRTLLLQHVRRLAGEGGGDDPGHAAAVTLALVRREAELFEGEAQHGTFPGTRIAEHPAYLLLGGAVLEPVPDFSDGLGLRRRRSEFGHAARAAMM